MFNHLRIATVTKQVNTSMLNLALAPPFESLLSFRSARVIYPNRKATFTPIRAKANAYNSSKEYSTAYKQCWTMIDSFFSIILQFC